MHCELQWASGKGTRFHFTEISVKKHMLSEALDAKAFRTLRMGDDPFSRQPIEKNKTKEVKT